MPGVLLLILKILGIIALIIACLAAYILLVPASYDIRVDLDSTDVNLRFSDPLRFYRVIFIRKDKNNRFEVSLLFTLIKLLPKKKKEKKEELKADAEKTTDDKKEKKKSSIPVSGIFKMIGDEKNRAAISHVLNKVMGFLRHLYPKRISGSITFGLSSPDNTGKLLGALSLLPFVYEEKLSIIPDFETEKNTISGQIHLSGNIMLIRIVIMVIAIIANKNVRRLIGKVLKLRKENKKAKKVGD